jgi:hypothetical protein
VSTKDESVSVGIVVMNGRMKVDNNGRLKKVDDNVNGALL